MARDVRRFVGHSESGALHRADQKALGMSMRAPRSTLDQVKAKLAAAKRKEPEVDDTEIVKARLAKAEADALAEKQKQKEEKKLRKDGTEAAPTPAVSGAHSREAVIAPLPPQVKLAPKVEVTAEALPADDLALMGLPMNFGTSKKNK